MGSVCNHPPSHASGHSRHTFPRHCASVRPAETAPCAWDPSAFAHRHSCRRCHAGAPKHVSIELFHGQHIHSSPNVTSRLHVGQSASVACCDVAMVRCFRRTQVPQAGGQLAASGGQSLSSIAASDWPGLRAILTSCATLRRCRTGLCRARMRRCSRPFEPSVLPPDPTQLFQVRGAKPERHCVRASPYTRSVGAQEPV